MAGFIFFIIIIIIIVNVSKKAQEQQTTVNKFLNDAINKRVEMPRKPNSVNNEASYQTRRVENSYYNKEKVSSYKKQDMDHAEHLVENESIDTKKIGYNKCPKCGTLNSKKLDKCFMCDAEIKVKE